MVNYEFKPLGKALNIVESTSFEATQTFDDLILVENNPFIIRFNMSDANKLHLHFNVDCEEQEIEKLAEIMTKSAQKEGLVLQPDSRFSMKPIENTSEVELCFKY